MREAPPSIVKGAILVFDSARKSGGTFVCSRCRTNFKTSDPGRAFELFASRRHKCAAEVRAASRMAPAVAGY